MIEATERSISALMMTRVMISATMIFSIESWKRLIWFWIVRNSGAKLALSAKVARKTARRPVSQGVRNLVMAGPPCAVGRVGGWPGCRG